MFDKPRTGRFAFKQCSPAHAHTHTFKRELENPFRMTNNESEPASVCDFTEDIGCMTQVRGHLHSVIWDYEKDHCRLLTCIYSYFITQPLSWNKCKWIVFLCLCSSHIGQCSPGQAAAAHFTVRAEKKWTWLVNGWQFECDCILMNSWARSHKKVCPCKWGVE